MTESGLGCPDWPLCYGRLIPPLRPDAIIEYTHRLVASLTSPLILISGIIAWKRFGRVKLIFRPMVAAMSLLVFEIVLGAITVLTKTPPVIVAIHLSAALTILAMVLTATINTFRLSMGLPIPDHLTYRSGFPRLSLWALAALFIVLLSGVFVAGSEATKACAGWPLCNGLLFPTTMLEWVHMIHRFIVGAAGILMVILIVQAWRLQRNHLAIYPAAAVSTVLFFAQAYVGALKTTHHFPVFLLALHVATAAATWAALVTLAVLTGSFPGKAEEAESSTKAI